jgi:hypothetical protein
MRITTIILTLILAVPLTAKLTYNYHAQIKAIVDPEKLEIVAFIKLENNCGVAHNAFEVLDLNTGLKVPFTAAGRARIETFEDNPLKLQMSKRFSAVQIDELPELAHETMVMTLDCSASDSVQEMFKSLKDTLGN